MANLRLFCSCFLLILVRVSVNLKIENLGGQWLVKDSTEKYNNLKATVPGGIYSDLMNNSVIGDILYGYNDTETRWVAQNNWTYYRQFSVDESILSHESINLVFEGLDTFSSIVLNNVEVGKSENMFVRYIFDVKDRLKSGANNLEVRFTSPITIAASLVARQNYSIPPNCPSKEYRGECHVNQIRKMQASFAWDWGPAFPSMGIWKSIYLEAFNSSVIRYVLISTKDSPLDDSWLINITTYLDPGKKEAITGKITHIVETDVTKIEQIVDVDHPSNPSGEVIVNKSFKIPKLQVKRWWPNGYGEQKLYQVSTEFQSEDEIFSFRPLKIGFRTIELIQDNTDSGLTFYFKINDVPIFAKGSNEIPLDILPERGQDPEVITRVLEDVKVANMNMIRVWGGGVYESDFFYTKADEFGILIWQDFMFACAMYPAYPEFLDNVIEEVKHQTRRLNYHPSIALWAGNNENEFALAGNWYGTKNNVSLYKDDYIKLYIDTIRDELFNNIGADNVIFLSSSPSNGKETEQEGFIAEDPQSQLFGDVHYYNYIFNSFNSAIYPVPRFASEFGYQSLPDVDSWLKVTDNISDLIPSSHFMDHRQHHPLGLVQNDLLINFQLPLDGSGKNYYKTYIYYLQIIQAMSVKVEVEIYRSFMGRVDPEGKGNTMGALFWQLNDVWIAPTWSGIDYFGKWKMLQYFALKFFAQTLIAGYLNTERQLKIYVVSEVPALIDSSLDVTVVVDIYNWNSFKAVNTTSVQKSIEYGKALEAVTLDTDNILKDLQCGGLDTAKNNCFFLLTLKHGDSIIAPTNFVLAGVLKESNLRNANVKISNVSQIGNDGKKFEITISTNEIALFVWLDSHEIKGRFSENGFFQVSPDKAITFESLEAASVEEINKKLTVTHLKDPQYEI